MKEKSIGLERWETHREIEVRQNERKLNAAGDKEKRDTKEEMQKKEREKHADRKREKGA